MALFEYFTAKLAKKGLIPSEVLTNHTSKSIAYEFVKIPFTILKTVVVGIFKWGLWVFNELVPVWVRIALFFVFLYFLYFSYQLFVAYGGFQQVVDEVVHQLTQ